MTPRRFLYELTWGVAIVFANVTGKVIDGLFWGIDHLESRD